MKVNTAAEIEDLLLELLLRDKPSTRRPNSIGPGMACNAEIKKKAIKHNEPDDLTDWLLLNPHFAMTNRCKYFETVTSPEGKYDRLTFG
jgi:hypothetical protein